MIAISCPTTDTATRSELITAQQLLWLGQKLAPQSPLYNMTFLFTLSGEIEPQHFKAAFDALVQRCDALRMVIHEGAGEPQRQVLPKFKPSVTVLDFSTTEDPAAAAREWSEQQSQQLFDLSQPLFDTALIRLASDRWAWYLNQHHLITDIVSVQRVYETVARNYRLSVEGKLSQATELPAYADVSLPTPSVRAIRHWQQEEATPVELYQRTVANISSSTRRVCCELGSDRTAQLKQLAAQIGGLTPQLSLFNLFATLLFAYLHRVGGQDRVSFATPAHGRPTAQLKDTIGVLIELFPLQAEIAPEETFASLLERVSSSSGQLLRYAQSGASIAASRDANVVLNFIHAQLPHFDGRPVRSDWIHPGAGDPRHYLRLQVHDFDQRGSLQLHFDWNCDLFEPELQERAVTHFLALVDAAIANLDQPIAKVSLLGSAEQATLFQLAKSPFSYPEPIETVVQQFEAQVEQTPDQTALICGEQRLTYAQLNRRANQLARYLRWKGVTHETPVGVCLPRSVNLLVAIWGVLKAGGTYVPLEPNHPKARIEHILRDTGVRWVLTHSGEQKVGEHTTAFDGEIVLDRLDLSAFPTDNLPASATNHLAYILYTSGSTGQPKGVEIEHRSLLNYVQWAVHQYIRGRTLAFPLFSPLTFDLTVTSLYVPLLSGGQIVIYPETSDAIDLSLQRIVQDDKVDVIKLTPSHLALVQGMRLGARVKTLILGGEDLKAGLADAILTECDRTLELYNEYGPTEATVGCMIHRHVPDPTGPASVPIGRPAAGSQIYLLDEQLQLVPQGAVGEICIGGPGLARGYLNRPELTTEKFVIYNGTRLYCTGDLGRWREDGQLAYLGRRDRQVKVHGTRVELGEIEGTISTHPAIQSTTVTVLQPQKHQPDDNLTYCTSCGIASNYPGISFDADGVCDICRTYETYKHRTEEYFQPLPEFRNKLEAACQRKRGTYDCMMLLSGGKDSTYALAQLVHMGFRVFAFTLDNGYISEQAKDNIRRVVTALNVDHEFGSTPAMNEIFVDSLNRFCNVCNGCFKTIYTLSMQLAYQRGIPAIVTGLSRGQFFETRLTEEWFTELFGQSEFSVEQIDQTVLAARKAYHRTEDAVSRLLDVEAFQSDTIFESVEILDFYRYCDVDLAEMLAFLRDRLPWIRPVDTGRSTNCLINNVGIHIHTQQRGYHNYALPYSWDVRMGHKTVDAAIDELNDDIDVDEVEKILQEIGYEDPTTKSQLVAYYLGEVTPTDLRTFLTGQLPSNLIPAYLVLLEQMPLTANGKVDLAQLPDPKQQRLEAASDFIPPKTAVEKTLAQLWQKVLKVQQVSLYDNFFELGGDSIMAIQIAARLSELGFQLSPNQVFQHPTLIELAATVAATVTEAEADLSGPIPLTPIQRQWLDQNPPEPEQFTQTLRLGVTAFLDAQRLEKSLDALIAHHDSLRLSFHQTDAGWQQQYQDAVAASTVIKRDLTALSLLEQQRQLETEIASLQTQLNLTTGDLVRAALIHLSEGTQLILVMHHLAVDAVSWTTLVRDLETVYQQLEHTSEPILSPKTSAFKFWAEGLQKAWLPESEQVYWRSQDTSFLARFGATPGPVEQAKTFSCGPDADLSKTLLAKGRVRERLLTAISLAVTRYCHQPAVTIDVEGHGREEALVPKARLARTVGWFTSLFPVTLRVDGDEPLESVTAALEQVPQNGIGYGILRYLNEPNCSFQEAPQAEILFNYLGDLDRLFSDSDLFQLATPLQVSHSPQQRQSHPLSVAAYIYNGQLQIDWCYSGVAESVVKQLSADTRQLLQTLLDDKTPTATDFPLAKLNNRSFDKLSALLSKADQQGESYQQGGV